MDAELVRSRSPRGPCSLLQIPLEPRKDALVAVYPMLALAEAVPFARIDDVVVRQPGLPHRLRHLRGLHRRHARIAVTVQDKERRADTREPIVRRGALHRLRDFMREA